MAQTPGLSDMWRTGLGGWSPGKHHPGGRRQKLLAQWFAKISCEVKGH